ncbi:flagellar hook-basal body protein [Cytobacillus sp. IB215665]|uniref:flagellar hook-basal body protein n=1 Tax=Cytobacillus sp. IB215665 TaxID=3097357 RepID=UPI002A0DB9AE|nr:flagellar hook-basal body protein [Cytobacillus sp. IB215665]MDX8363725.1 flagellar hook-basal body protein [Cytobacillus sp. IB215665]
MLRGFYTAASGMISQQRKTDMLTNNMANANTPGYKAEQGSLRAFPEMLLQQLGTSSIPGQELKELPYAKTIGTINTGVYLQETIPNFTQGYLRETGLHTDLALLDVAVPNNEGLFFTVQSANGDTLYTRNGNFTIDGQGYLTTSSGHYVLDENNAPIQVGSGQFTVNSDGTVLENNEIVGRINIAYATDTNTLIKDETGMLRTENNQALPSANTNQGIIFKIEQGFIEGSNVDTTQTMTDLMTSYRAFEANQKILQAYDKSMDKAVNEIGRLR